MAERGEPYDRPFLSDPTTTRPLPRVGVDMLEIIRTGP